MKPKHTKTTKRAPAGTVPGVGSSGLLGHFIKLPKRSDVWKTPHPRSNTALLICSRAPEPWALRWYPALPTPCQKVWGVWRNGFIGYAVYSGAWTYKSGGGYFNEMPIAWHPA